MATEPDDIAVDAASPANDDRVQEILYGKVDFDAKQSTAQMPRKSAGQCRMVVEIPFEFSAAFLKENGVRDGVDYLRFLKKEFEADQIDVEDLIKLSIEHSENGLRVEAAK